MSYYRIAIIATLTAVCSACTWFERDREPELRYIPVPEAWLTLCELPERPEDNGDMSVAFAIAYQCARQGNTDKTRIRKLTERLSSEHDAKN